MTLTFLTMETCTICANNSLSFIAKTNCGKLMGIKAKIQSESVRDYRMKPRTFKKGFFIIPRNFLKFSQLTLSYLI